MSRFIHKNYPAACLMTAAMTMMSWSPLAVAQTKPAFPAKPVTIMTPFAAGSGPDAVLRKVGEVLSQKWMQRVVIDNRPGGAGFVAIDAARRAAPDGYTLLLLDSEHVSALPYLFKKRGFKTFESFDPVAVLYRTTFLVAVPVDSKLKSISDLVGAAKASSGNMTYGSWGVGSAGHLGGVMLEDLDGLKMQHVAYREMSQLFISVANSDVSWSLATLPSSRAVYQSGKIRYLAVASRNRLPQLPNVPTVAEAGGPAKFEVNSIAYLVSPKGLADELSLKINADIAEALADRDVKASFETFAFEPLFWSRQEMLVQAQNKAGIYQKLVDRNSINLD